MTQIRLPHFLKENADHLYRYAVGNPVSFVDPRGESSLRIGGTVGGGAGAGGYATLGVAVSYSQEHGLMGGFFANSGQTANAGQPGFSGGLAIIYSPSENKLENGGTASVIHGAEFHKGVGLGIDHAYSLDGSGEHSVTLTVGAGMTGEYHTGIEYEQTWGATQLINGSGSLSAEHDTFGGSTSSSLPDFSGSNNSSSNRDLF